MSEQKKKWDFKRILTVLKEGLVHLVLHNGWLKVIAILISVILWAGLISQDESITRDKEFQNVKVSVTGTEALKANGFIVVSGLDDLYANFVAAVPQKQYDNAEASAYNLRLDLSRINTVGSQEVKIQDTRTNLYGRAVSITPSTVTLEVERYQQRTQIPASVKLNGDPPEGWYCSLSGCDPLVLEVGGPISITQKISRAIAYIDPNEIEWSEKTDEPVYSEFQLYNRAGDVIDDSMLNITSSSVKIEKVQTNITVMPQKAFDTEGLVEETDIRGAAADGYAVTGISISPSVIRIADSSDVLDDLNELLIESKTLDISGLTGTKLFPLKVLKPSDNSILSTDTVIVTVEINPTEQ